MGMGVGVGLTVTKKYTYPHPDTHTLTHTLTCSLPCDGHRSATCLSLSLFSLLIARVPFSVEYSRIKDNINISVVACSSIQLLTVSENSGCRCLGVIPISSQYPPTLTRSSEFRGLKTTNATFSYMSCLKSIVHVYPNMFLCVKKSKNNDSI
jgi:hypothetical protein